MLKNRVKTRGAEVFSQLLDGGIGSKKLQKILRRVHGTNNDHTTTLLHPTLPTLLSMDLILHPSFWSEHSKILDKTLTSMKKVFSLYCLTDALEMANIEFKPIDITKIIGLEDNDLKELLETELFDRVIKCRDESRFDERINMISEIFLEAIKLYLILGVVPCVESEYDLTSIPLRATDDLAITLDNYCWIYENGLSKIRLMTTQEVINDLIITDNNGVRTMSRVYSNVEVIPMDFNTRFNFIGTLFNTNISELANIIPEELKLTYAKNEGKKFILDRLKKINLIVSSKVTKEAADMIAMVSKNELQSEDDLKLAAKKKEDSEKKLEKLLEKRSLLLDNANLGIGSDGDKEPSASKRMQSIESDLRSSERIQLLLANGESISDKSVEDTDKLNSLMDVTTKYFDDMPQNPYGLHDPSKSKNKQTTKDMKTKFKVLQEQEIAKNMKILENMLRAKILEAEMAEKKTLEAMLKHETQINLIDELKRTIKIMNEKTDELKKTINNKDKLNEKLMSEVKMTGDMVNNVAKSLKLSDEDRHRLMNINAKLSNANKLGSIIPVQERLEEATSAIMSIFSGYGTEKNVKNNKQKEMDVARSAYDRVLSEECIRPTPIFKGVKFRNDLKTVNSWLMEDWMCDTEINDLIYQKEIVSGQIEDMEITSEGAVKGDIIEESQNMYVIDVNPLTEERIKLMADFYESNDMSRPPSIFERQYMSMQFKAKGDLKASISDPLKEQWKAFVSCVFKVKSEVYTVVGNTLPDKLTSESMMIYGSTFAKMFGGVEMLKPRKIDTVINTVIELEDVVGSGSIEEKVMKDTTEIILKKERFRLLPLINHLKK